MERLAPCRVGCRRPWWRWTGLAKMNSLRIACLTAAEPSGSDMKFSSRTQSTRRRQRALTLAVFFVTAAALSTPSVAADVVNDGRSTPGTIVPSSGTTGGARALTPARAPQPRTNAGSLSGPGSGSTGRCMALRKRYAQSQACFERFRLHNGGLRPGASKHCKEIKNPSLQCGSEIVG